MPEYRRAFVPGGTFFLTIVTHQRHPLLAKPDNVGRLYRAIESVRQERPFEILASVILPDHIHFIWELPVSNPDFSTRVGRMKALFTKSLRQANPQADGGQCPPYVLGRRNSPTYVSGERNSGSLTSSSRAKHRESNVWQRRFWEHTIRDGRDFQRHVDYIHYNPVKHGLVNCPHQWPYSTFPRWVQESVYENDWCCCCNGKHPNVTDFSDVEHTTGE